MASFCYISRTLSWRQCNFSKMILEFGYLYGAFFLHKGICISVLYYIQYAWLKYNTAGFRSIAMNILTLYKAYSTDRMNTVILWYRGNKYNFNFWKLCLLRTKMPIIVKILQMKNSEGNKPKELKCSIKHDEKKHLWFFQLQNILIY